MAESGLQLLYRLKTGEWLSANSAFRIGYTKPLADRREYTLREGYRDPDTGLTIDALGFRITRPEASSHQPVIVCAGDSVPFGAGVGDEETYSSYLAEALASQGSSAGVVNAGVPSYNLRQTFDRLHQDVLPRYRPILLVTIEAANDISLLTHYKDDWTPERTWAAVRWSQSWGVDNQLRKLAMIHYLSRYVALSWKEPLQTQTHPESQGSLQTEAMLEHVRHVLREELAFLRDRSITVVLLPINPFYYQVQGASRNPTLRNWREFKRYVDEWDGLIQRYNETLQKMSQEFPNAYFFDTRKVMDSYDRDLLYIDYIHHSALGNRILASSLAKFLGERGLLSESKVRHDGSSSSTTIHGLSAGLSGPG
jgi:lysophospholipase L1-like esterase